MDRISGPNYVTIDGERMWQDRNPATGTPGTFGNALWFNGVQEELMTLLAVAGIAPAPNVNNQVSTALYVLYGGGGAVLGSGWQRLPGGLIIQWGNGVTASGDEDVVYFPTTFPNHAFNVTVTEGNAVGWGSPPQPTIYGATPSSTGSFLVSASYVPRGGGAPVYSRGSGFNFVALGN